VNWAAAGGGTTFSGGTVGNPPPTNNQIIDLLGGHGVTDTVTFSTPVINPVLAIWSLGSGGTPASFVFPLSELATIESGGPSIEYGGSSITACPTNAVCGLEGNGTVQLTGTFSQITWTNPQPEGFYGFTVGEAGAAGGAVPEPATLLLLGTGLVGGVRRWRKSRMNS
jgi:hypothetical protein